MRNMHHGTGGSCERALLKNLWIETFANEKTGEWESEHMKWEEQNKDFLKVLFVSCLSLFEKRFLSWYFCVLSRSW